MFKSNGIVLFLAMGLLLAGAFTANADEKKNAGPSLAELIKRANTIASKHDGEDIDNVWLHCEAIDITMRLALWSGDKPTLQNAEKALGKLVKRGRRLDDPYLRDYAISSRALAIAGLGQWEKAHELAETIPATDQRAFAFASFAVERGRKGDFDSYRNELDAALKLLDLAVKIEFAKPADDRELIEYTVAYTLYTVLNDLLIVSDWPRDKALQEVDRLATLFSKIPRSPGAKAEVACTLAYAYAFFGQPQKARDLLKAVKKHKAEEQKIVDQFGEDAEWMAYGLDSVRAAEIEALVVLGDVDAADAVSKEIEDDSARQNAEQSYILQLIVARDTEKAKARLKDNITAVLKMEVDAPGPDEDFDEDREYTYVGDVHWAYYSAAENAYWLNDKTQLDRLRTGAKTESLQLAIDLGIAWAHYRPLVQSKTK